MGYMLKKAFLLVLTLLVAISLISSCAAQEVIERTCVITLEGRALTLLGPELTVGQKAPDFSLLPPVDRVESVPDTEEVTLSESQGKLRLISVVPSLDTPVCDLQTRRFEEEASKFKEVAFYTISMDLPFAQDRYCGAHDIKDLTTLSDHRDGSFGLAYGVLVKELNLLSRAIFIIGEDDTVEYVDYLGEISEHPDYDRALNVLRDLVGEPAQSAPPPGVTEGIEVGDLAPDFELANLEGELVSLSDFQGKPVLLNLWAAWCPHCRNERPWIQQIYDEWTDRGLELVTVDLIGTRSTETPHGLRDYMETNSYTFPVLLDIDQEVLNKYELVATPTNVFIDKNGVIQEKKVGPFSSLEEMEESLSKILE
jgi:thiol peroxidase